MVDSVTNNLQLLEMATGSASGTWGSLLNSNVITLLDQALGNTQSVSLSSSNVTLTMSQRQALAFALTGTLTTNVSVSLPFNANSTTVAVGGVFIFDNETTGAFSVTVKTVASGSTGVEVPQGVRSTLYSDTTNVWFADDAQNQVATYNGDPNGNVAGKAGSASTRASKIINRATNVEYLCTTSGTASSAAWFPNLPFTFPCQGYLTASSSTDSPVLTSDSTGATTIYYTAFRGNQFFVYNGVSFVPVTITGGQLSLALSGSAQASNGIYDVIGFSDSGTPRIGFSPAWSTNTAGSCSRGTGAGTPQMTRVNGVPVNAVSQTVNNGATTYTVAANRGTILGTVWIDSTAGQVTCHRTYGQSRKFGIWNVYNRLPIYLKAGDPTSSWTYATASYRASNNNSANSLTVLQGLAEEVIDIKQNQNGQSNVGSITYASIGVNSTSAQSGYTIFGQAASGFVLTFLSAYEAPPSLGINTVYSIEKSNGTLQTYYGTEISMLLSARWMG